jgi:hypothetical protein
VVVVDPVAVGYAFEREVIQELAALRVDDAGESIGAA